VYEDAGGDWVPVIEQALGVPVALASYGPRAVDKRVRERLRSWSARAGDAGALGLLGSGPACGLTGS
jgi:hypothetical protein